MRGKLLAALVVIGILFLRGRDWVRLRRKRKLQRRGLRIRAGRLIDGKSDSVVMNALILVENEPNRNR